MTDADKTQLYRVILDYMASGAKRKHVETSIYDAHNGRPDGRLVTTDNMWMFRQYRNSVSPSPAHMVDAALAYGGTADV